MHGGSRKLQVWGAAALVVGSLAACTSGNSSSTPSPSSSASAPSSPATSKIGPTAASTGTTSSSSSSSALVALKAVGGERTTLALPASFLNYLNRAGVHSHGVGTASLVPVGTSSQVRLPITGGTFTAYKAGTTTPALQGTLDHTGAGVTLTQGDASVTLKNLRLRLGTKPALVAELEVTSTSGKTTVKSTQLDILDLSTTGVKAPTTSKGITTVRGLKATLSTAARTDIDDAFTRAPFAGAVSVAAGTVTVAVSD